ncbi:MAG: T9SS type A sorting domain-containing protein [Ignavibacteriae bacterium]|nr:T9SS type A sorting domain-containing protein [Ignavibacteriota bacterium]
MASERGDIARIDLGSGDVHQVPALLGGDVRCTAVGVHPSGLIFAATRAHGVYVSHDTGLSFERLAASPADIGECRALSILADGTILVGGTGVIYRSSDVGATWTRSPLPGNAQVNAFAYPAHGSTVTCALLPGLLVTEDAGLTWRSIYQGPVPLNVTFIAGDYASMLYIVQIDIQGKTRLYRIESGQTWSLLYTNAISQGMRAITVSRGYVAIGHRDGLDLSTNQGSQWSTIGSVFVGRSIDALDIDDEGNVFAGCSSRTPVLEEEDRDGGVFVSSMSLNRLQLTRPTLLRPIPDAMDNASIDTLVWRAVSGATEYLVSVKAVAGSLRISRIVKDTFFVTAELERGQKYGWTVTAKNDIWSGPIVDGCYFYTGPEKPILYLPENGSTVEIPFSFQWKPCNQRSGYHLQCAVDSLFTAVVFDSSGITDLSVVNARLPADTIIYWRVAGMVGNETGIWSAIWKCNARSFIPLPAVRLLRPEHEYRWVVQGCIFQWHEVTHAESYTIQISTEPYFRTLVYERTDVPIPQIAIDTLELHTKYYWRVRAARGAEIGPWSETWRFEHATKPNSPVLVAPAHDAQLPYNSAFLSWKHADDATLYRVQVSTSNTFHSSFFASTTSDSLYVGKLLPQKKYFWRVICENPTGVSDRSEIRSFITGIVSAIDAPRSTPADATLGPNAPNPFSFRTIIPFTIDRSTRVTLTIHDALGRLVTTLVDGVREAGTHQARFDAQGLPAGVYVIRLEAGGGTVTRTIIAAH